MTRRGFIAAGIAGLVLAVILNFVSVQNRILKTRFVLHAFGRYLQAYKLVDGSQHPIRTIADLPDFYLVSYNDSLSLKSRDLRSRVIDGYFYDFQRSGDCGFVISASPLRPGFWGAVEFGVIEDGNLRVNRRGVDSLPDTCDEVRSWAVVPEWFELQTVTESG